MSNFSSFEDTFEKAWEMGASAVKKTGSQVKKGAVSATSQAVSNITGSVPKQSSDKGIEGMREALKKQNNHTKLDPQRLAQLEEGYKKQDEGKVDEVRDKLMRYFRLEKESEARAIEQLKQEEEERKRREQEEEEQKKAKEQAENKNDLPMPKGKERKSIFAKQKKRSSSMETKVGSGKQ